MSCDLTSSIKRAVSNFNFNSFDRLIELKEKINELLVNVLNCSKFAGDHLFKMAKRA